MTVSERPPTQADEEMTPPPDDASAAAPLPILTMDRVLSDLGKRAAPRAEVDVPEWGTRVVVRGLTRAEAIWVMDQATKNNTQPLSLAVQEREYLCIGMVEPKFTASHYARIRHVPGASGVLNRLGQRIQELTMGESVKVSDDNEVSGLDAAYFPPNGALATAARDEGE